MRTWTKIGQTGPVVFWIEENDDYSPLSEVRFILVASLGDNGEFIAVEDFEGEFYYSPSDLAFKGMGVRLEFNPMGGLTIVTLVSPVQFEGE